MHTKKKILLFTVLLIASAMSTAGFCLTIDAQRETVCGLDYCETTVNLTKYFASSVITNLKTIDLRAFLPSKIQGISYKYDGNSLIVYGKIPIGSKNYWTMNLNGLATIDPWWNTSYTSCQNISINNIGGSTLTSFQVPFNLTYDPNMMANFSDLVFVNDTCNGLSNSIPLDFYLRNIALSTWVSGYVEVDTIPNNTYRNISVYYNNPNVTQISNNNISLACLFGDDFNRANSNTLNNGWVETGDAGDTHLTILNNQLQLYGDGSTWDYCTHTFANQTGLGVIADFFIMSPNSTSTEAMGRYAGDSQNYADGSGITIGLKGGQFVYYASTPAWTNIVAYSPNVWYDVEAVKYTLTKESFKINGTFYGNYTPWGSIDDMAENNFGINDAKYAYIDDICTRKYASPMPSISFSNEQNYSATTPTSTTLYIANTHANLTTGCSWETTNYTAWNNATLPIWIMYNGTHASNGTGSTQWYGSLIAGVWNITANTSGNATFGSSSDWLIHTITLGDPSSNVSITFNTTPSGNNTTCINTAIQVNCSSYALEDGVYLFNGTDYIDKPYNFTATADVTFTCMWNSSDCYNAGNITRTLNVEDCSAVLENTSLSCSAIPEGTIYTFQCVNSSMRSQKWIFGNTTCTAYETCWNECDNVTMSCNPLPYQQNLYLFGIVGFIAIGMMIIWRRRR